LKYLVLKELQHFGKFKNLLRNAMTDAEIIIIIIIIHILLLQSALQPLVGFRSAQLSLSILSRKVLQSAVASGTSNPQLGGEPGI
jgi:hypothetical protein